MIDGSNFPTVGRTNPLCEGDYGHNLTAGTIGCNSLTDESAGDNMFTAGSGDDSIYSLIAGHSGSSIVITEYTGNSRLKAGSVCHRCLSDCGDDGGSILTIDSGDGNTVIAG